MHGPPHDRLVGFTWLAQAIFAGREDLLRGGADVGHTAQTEEGARGRGPQT
jgi:hypothetical protein